MSAGQSRSRLAETDIRCNRLFAETVNILSLQYVIESPFIVILRRVFPHVYTGMIVEDLAVQQIVDYC